MMKIQKIHTIFACVFFLNGCGYLQAAGEEKESPAQDMSAILKKHAAPGGDIVSAMTWEKKVKPGVSAMEVELTMASVAAEHNIKPVGEFQVSQEGQTSSGDTERFIKIYSFCSPSVAKQFIRFSPQMAAFMPCRIALVENEDGLWLYTMNLDILLQSELQLPPELASSANKLRSAMVSLLERGGEGEF